MALGAERGHLSDWTTRSGCRRPDFAARHRLEVARPPGYVVVREESRAWSRTVAAMTEQLHVHREGSELHADHALRLWGRPFLRLHYAMLPV